MQGALTFGHLPAFVLHRQAKRHRVCSKPFSGRHRLFSSACRAKNDADTDLQLVKREETSDGAILFVFGNEAAVAASKAAEAADKPSPTSEPEAQPEAAYEAARAEKVQEGAAASDAVSTEAPAALNGAVVPDFSEDASHDDELLSDEDAPDLQDEIAKTLTSLRVADLKEMCKERKITGYSKMRKSQLVRTLKDAMLVDAD